MPRQRFESRFFSRSLRGLWAPREPRCVYIIEPLEGSPTPVWPLRKDERLRGLQWAPRGGSFAATVKRLRDGWRVDVIARDGRLLARHSARGAAFVRDGRLALLRRNGLYLLEAGRLRRLATASDLQKAAGFRAIYTMIGEPFSANDSGHGDGWIAVLWTNARLQQVLLTVSISGEIRRASPLYGPNSRLGYSIGGIAWSPDGRELFEMPDAPWRGPGFKDHDHCLDSWTPMRGFRRLWCISQLPKRFRFHFDQLAWSSTGDRGLLNNGTVVTRRGTLSGRVTGYNGAFSIHWSHPATARLPH